MAKLGGFPGGGMNIQNLMKQAQKMQADMQKKQEEVASKEIVTSAGGEAVVQPHRRGGDGQGVRPFRTSGQEGELPARLQETLWQGQPHPVPGRALS